ncbi:MAG TPA: hypothetical protein VEK34_16775 [Methylocella sp.]|nr:hypothetical protein [Methylocella sp.]
MQGETFFERAQFKKSPPKFFGATLHEGTVWPDLKTWPLPKTKDEAGDFIRAYERLKLEMDRLKKHEDELNFFALELQSRRISQGIWKGFPILIYGALSDYGRSYIRPLITLGVVAAIGAIAFSYFAARPILEAIGLSCANTLNVFGFRKDFFDLAKMDLGPWLDVIAAIQTILGAILLFLVGLGIRNKFRMK